ncbi:hypothetical protein pb186bvf_006255 [Paramecium bursaria]
MQHLMYSEFVQSNEQLQGGLLINILSSSDFSNMFLSIISKVQYGEQIIIKKKRETNKKEDSNLNQYWFSQSTIEFLVKHIKTVTNENESLAFLSTPSVYFTLKQPNAKLFEYDKQFETDKGFVFYDFNNPIIDEYKNHFDFILIDPPFITEEVWTKYAQTINHIRKENTKILCCSIKENDKMLYKLIGVQPVKFMPSIPNLIYQYNFYSNYNHEDLDQSNPEL